MPRWIRLRSKQYHASWLLYSRALLHVRRWLIIMRRPLARLRWLCGCSGTGKLTARTSCMCGGFYCVIFQCTMDLMTCFACFLFTTKKSNENFYFFWNNFKTNYDRAIIDSKIYSELNTTYLYIKNI